MLLLPVSFIEYLSSSDMRVIYFGGVYYPPSVSGNYILKPLSPVPFFLGMRFLSLLSISLIFMLQEGRVALLILS